MRCLGLLCLGFIFVLSSFLFTQVFSIFVVNPIGAVPEGRTLIIFRLNNMNFIDSADGMCERAMEGVSLLCRGVMLGAVASKSTILIRLPYSETLYLFSTGGKKYAQ